MNNRILYLSFKKKRKSCYLATAWMKEPECHNLNEANTQARRQLLHDPLLDTESKLNS